jgi:hypothetical protein
MGMMFPASVPDDVMIGITTDSKTEAAEIYEVIRAFLNEDSLPISSRVTI